MNGIGNLLRGVGMFVLIIAGIWGFFLCLAIISHAAGFWGLLAAIFLGPVTFIAAPLYAGFEHGDWFPLALNYGGSLVGIALVAIGNAMSND